MKRPSEWIPRVPGTSEDDRVAGRPVPVSTPRGHPFQVAIPVSLPWAR
jgi:hypothetical protein